MSHAGKFTALALAGAVTLGTVATASAAPVASSVAAIKEAATSPVETIHYRRGFGPGPFVAGAILGAAALGVATGGFGYGYGPAYYPAYYPAYSGYYPAYSYRRVYYRPAYRPYAYYSYGPRRFHRYHYGW